MSEESSSADSIGEESQNHEHDLQSTWQNIKGDEDMIATLRRMIKEIANSKNKVPEQINDAAKAVLTISSGINAIIIFICLLLTLV